MAGALLAAIAGLPTGASAAGPQGAEPPVEALRPYSMPRTAMFDVRSATGDVYSVMVAWPDAPPPVGGWPVLYLLDGEDSFPVAVPTARRLARAGARSGVSEGLVVAIAAGPLTRRVRDYTPPIAGYAIPAGQPASGIETGGADAFLDMLAGQVMPAVRKRWPVDEKRETLLGHSFGGLLALHAMLSRPAMFDAAVAISPSLWFGDGLIEREIGQGPAVPGPRRLLVAEGDERAPADARSHSSASAIVQRLQENVPAMESSFLHLPGQSHGTTFLAGLASAIRFAFERPDP